MLEIALSHSCLDSDQTVVIRIKSREMLMFSPHELQAFSHREYAVLVHNIWLVWGLKERGGEGTNEIGLIYDRVQDIYEE